MIGRSSLKVTISAPEKTLIFEAKFVELESTVGHIVIFPNHAPIVFSMPENSKLFLEQASGGPIVLDVGQANAMFGQKGMLLIIKNIF